MPGVKVNITNAPAPSSRPTETGKLFAIGQCERGSTTEPVFIHSPGEFKAKLGSQVSGTFLQPGGESFFQEGGYTLIVGRVVGSAAVTASCELATSGAVKVLKVKASSPGEWGNKLSVKITTEPGSKYSITILEGLEEIEKVTELASAAAAVAWSKASSKLVAITELATGLPAEATTALASGTNGEAINTASYERALALFSSEYGTGLVAAPGVTSLAVHELLLAHGEANDRAVLLDSPSAATEAELLTEAALLTTKTGARRGAAFSTWVNIPGVTANTTRLAPYSTVQAGILARNDAKTSPPKVNEASAGLNGIPRYVESLVKTFNKTQLNTLNAGKVNVIRALPGGAIETYGDVSLAPASEPAWAQFTSTRLFCFVSAEGEAILETFEFKPLDPHRNTINKAGAALQSFLEELGSQLQNNAREAVNVGTAVNTPETIAKKELIANLEVHPTGAVESETLNITAQG